MTNGGWWECEEQVLIGMYTDWYRVEYIARVLNRNLDSVYSKIRQLKDENRLKMK
ncbi:hypothetical protein [Acinetobacter phage HFM1]|nr:hypothetical protein [Acinetobacter phage HFM1]